MWLEGSFVIDWVKFLYEAKVYNFEFISIKKGDKHGN